MTLLLDNQEVESAITAQDAIGAMESIYRELGNGEAFVRPRTQIYWPFESKQHPGHHFRFKVQQGGSVHTGIWALRLTSDMSGVSFSSGVKRREIIPVATGNRFCGLVILFDIERLEPVAIMPDGILQKMRVAALSTVGAKYLAPENPKTLGLFGSGWQAGAHIEALCSTFDLEQVKVYSPTPQRVTEFCERWSRKLDRPVTVAGSRREVVEGSDIVQAATSAWEPVFDGSWVEKGMYVASIGGADADSKRRELDDETIRRADLYVVHSKELAKAEEAPDIWGVVQKGFKNWDEIVEIQDVVAGTAPRRTRRDQITAFNNNIGAGTQFAAVGAVVLKRAKEKGLGRELPTEWFLEVEKP